MNTQLVGLLGRQTSQTMRLLDQVGSETLFLQLGLGKSNCKNVKLSISGVNPDNIRQWNVLQGIQDRNETLFYK
jgi:hypothetical protein